MVHLSIDGNKNNEYECEYYLKKNLDTCFKSHRAMTSESQRRAKEPKWKIIPTKVRVISAKKSSTKRAVYVWRNVNLITPPTIQVNYVFNEGTGKYEKRKNVVHVPDTEYIKTTKDLNYS